MANKTITGVCSDLTSEGKGVIKFINETIFVDGLLLGEKAEVEIIYRTKGVAYGKIVRLIEKSKDRIEPLCKISSSCGGCTFQNAIYEYELKYKKKKVEDALKRIGHIDVPVNDVIGMEDAYHYRNKIQVPFQRNGKDIIYGFYKAKTHKIIPNDECYIEDIRARDILKTIKSLMLSMKIEPYNEDNRSGVIRHVLIRTSYHYEDIMVVLVTNCDSFASRNNFVKALIERCPNITTVVQNINKRDTNVILGEEEKTLYGRGFIRDSILGINFNISSKSFFQVNPKQVEILYQKAFDLVGLTKNDRLLDAYSGVGTIGMIASQYVKDVTCVELEKSAHKNAVKNAKDNGIENINLINEDCTDYLVNTDDKFDVVIMDAPRKGSTPEFLNALVKNGPSKIAYISCNPATLARDLTYLVDDYEIKEVQPVDMFPRTYHTETIVALFKKEKK
ncbi:MAG: 23S rRNA (uracil(1939)-C(5))-methyltransferase RlmD [Coprobacillus sp.]|nr:23S rRNA (uracil(1939)-C(5))-methyltransferase RlmD [Coprobacillus sp.]